MIASIPSLSPTLASRCRVCWCVSCSTPEFMAPEVYDESYDERCDIYRWVGGWCSAGPDTWR